ncbi:MAG: hypothetical protein ACR2NU_14645 [Aeoliella sp.]
MATLLVLLATASGAHAQPPTASNEFLAQALADIVREAIPKTYEKRKDWGNTKNITTGVKTSGSLLKLRIHRRKKAVSHGTWKHYRVDFVEPEEKLIVTVDNLRSLEGGGVGLTLIVDAHLQGWAQMRHYNRGVHLLTLTSEGRSKLRLEIDCEVRLQLTKEGMALNPNVTAARLDLRDFELTRFGEAKGELAYGLGKGMKRLMEDQLDSTRLTAKLNRAIDKKRDRLTLTPAKLLGNE